MGAPLKTDGHDTTRTDCPPAGAKTRKEWWDHWGFASRGQAHNRIQGMIRDGYMKIVGQWDGVDYICLTGKKIPEPPPDSFTARDYAREAGIKERTAQSRLRNFTESGAVVCVGQFTRPNATHGGRITRYYMWR